MTEIKASLDERINLEPVEFVKNLTESEKMLLKLKHELYSDTWREMRDDLRNRLNKRPFLYLMMDRITKDVEVMQQLESYENRTKSDLYALMTNSAAA